ncbi:MULTISPECIES: hypothetical protein [Microbacterium]|uniref:Integral membrane protein n=1 Tax=Microbacterium plantarum TaxID=1816425 RepID=A0ABV5EQS3_9MICO|nr:hypothetical protein [Microbacterium arborescens]
MSTDERPRTRREERAAVRADRSGSGPTLEGRPQLRHPGAVGAFALLGEVLLIGLLIGGVSLAVVTLPVALAAGVRHLRRYVAADDSRLSLFWADVRAGLLPGAAVGLVTLVVTLILLLDIDLARSGFLPGGVVIEAVGWAGLAALAVALLTAAGSWSPELGWRGAVRAIPDAARGDVVGSLYLLATAAFVVIVTWALPPLFVAGIGCAALAVVAIPARPRRT